jgi:hypothetical protein
MPVLRRTSSKRDQSLSFPRNVRGQKGGCFGTSEARRSTRSQVAQLRNPSLAV